MGGLSAAAEEASPACDQAGHDDAIALLEAIDASADFFDHADAFMAEHEAGLDGQSAVIEVEVGAADAGASDAHEGVGGSFERGVVDALDADIVGAVEDSSFHNLTPNKKVATKTMREGIIACAAGGMAEPCTQCEAQSCARRATLLSGAAGLQRRRSAW